MKKITLILIVMCIIMISGITPRTGEQFTEKIIEESKVKRIESNQGNNNTNFKIEYQNELYTFTSKFEKDYNSFLKNFDYKVYEIVDKEERKTDDTNYIVIYKKR